MIKGNEGRRGENGVKGARGREGGEGPREEWVSPVPTLYFIRPVPGDRAVSCPLPLLLAGFLQLLQVIREELLPLPHLLHNLEPLVLPITQGKLTETRPASGRQRKQDDAHTQMLSYLILLNCHCPPYIRMYIMHTMHTTHHTQYYTHCALNTDPTLDGVLHLPRAF